MEDKERGIFLSCGVSIVLSLIMSQLIGVLYFLLKGEAMAWWVGARMLASVTDGDFFLNYDCSHLSICTVSDLFRSSSMFSMDI